MEALPDTTHAHTSGLAHWDNAGMHRTAEARLCQSKAVPDTTSEAGDPGPLKTLQTRALQLTHRLQIRAVV